MANTASMRRTNAIRRVFRSDAGSGIALILAAALALGWANSPWSGSYESLWNTKLGTDALGLHLRLDLRHWVNDAAMAVFFLVVGLEIKRELTSGHLVGRRAAALPVAAAVGGMVAPALLYLAIAGGTAPRGWGVPMATDIALALSVVALSGSAVPSSARALLLGLAVVDDIGAILVIAFVYSDGVSALAVAVALAAVATAAIVQRAGINRLAPYIALGVVAWLALLEAGVHPTLAGVAMGVIAPTRVRPGTDEPTVTWLEHRIQPWSGLLILPLFALANAGVTVSRTAIGDAFDSRVSWGILIGLVVGKPVGVLLAVAIAVRTRIAAPLGGTTARHLLGVGTAAGIGFTVSIFVAELAFKNSSASAAEQLDAAKLAVLAASIISGIAATALLRRRQSSASNPVTSASPSR